MLGWLFDIHLGEKGAIPCFGLQVPHVYVPISEIFISVYNDCKKILGVTAAQDFGPTNQEGQCGDVENVWLRTSFVIVLASCCSLHQGETLARSQPPPGGRDSDLICINMPSIACNGPSSILRAEMSTIAESTKVLSSVAMGVEADLDWKFVRPSSCRRGRVLLPLALILDLRRTMSAAPGDRRQRPARASRLVPAQAAHPGYSRTSLRSAR